MTCLTAIVTILIAGVFHPSPEKAIRHDFKLSVCEIVWNESGKQFDVKFYIFHDDLREAVYGKPDYPRLDPEEVNPYLLKHFQLLMSSTVLKLTFDSVQEKNDQVLYKFSTPKLTLSPNEVIRVRNTLLTEKFTTQVNMVYLIFPDKAKQTQMLTVARTEATFKL